MLHCIDAATNLVQKHIQSKQGDPYKEQFNQINKWIVGNDYFSQQQIEEQVQTAKENCKILQNELAAQKTTEVDCTAESLRMVKYTSIKKPDGENKGHSEDLKKEMMHWGLTSTEFQDLKATKQ
jgi:hypothetical protein